MALPSACLLVSCLSSRATVSDRRQALLVLGGVVATCTSTLGFLLTGSAAQAASPAPSIYEDESDKLVGRAREMASGREGLVHRIKSCHDGTKHLFDQSSCSRPPPDSLSRCPLAGLWARAPCREHRGSREPQVSGSIRLSQHV